MYIEYQHATKEGPHKLDTKATHTRQIKYKRDLNHNFNDNFVTKAKKRLYCWTIIWSSNKKTHCLSHIPGQWSAVTTQSATDAPQFVHEGEPWADQGRTCWSWSSWVFQMMYMYNIDISWLYPTRAIIRWFQSCTYDVIDFVITPPFPESNRLPVTLDKREECQDEGSTIEQ